MFTLHLGDCLHSVTGMPGLPPKSVDHVLTDPAYVGKSMKNRRSGSTIKKRHEGKNVDFGYEGLRPWVRWYAAAEFARIARGWVQVWCDVESTHLWREAGEEAGMEYVRTGFWLRELDAPQFSGDRPAQDSEAYVLFWAGDGRMRWNGRGKKASHRGDLGADYAGPIVNANSPERIHTSPKPLWLMERVIADFTNRGELVCDPFAGSASLGVAALRAGRNFLGWEIAPAFHAEALHALEGTHEVRSMIPDAPKVKRRRMPFPTAASAGGAGQ